MQILGIDIGGSGIKGAPVDTKKGVLLAERLRFETPVPAKPAAVAKVVGEIARHFKWKKRIGVGFPGVVDTSHVAHSAPNLHPAWVGKNLSKLFAKSTGCEVTPINDADAAGLAEIGFGAGCDVPGNVLLLTLGTGIGSALFLDGKLYRNSELGHLLFKGGIAEKYAAASIRKAEGLDWETWGKRLNEYLWHVEHVISPDLIILGGGVSAKFHKYKDLLDVPDVKIVPAKQNNDAGIIGAALAAK